MRGHDLAIINATVWPGPEQRPVAGCTVIVRAGRIESVGTAVAPRSRQGIPEWDARGRVVTAGFWNCHVHLTEPVWSGSRRRQAGQLQAALDEMLVSHGFTNAVDLASNSRDTLPLIARIESGELTGPSIVTATEAIHPARGLPFYTRESVPWFLHWVLPTPWTRGGARRAAARQLRRGAGVIKLFTGSYVERDRIKVMDPRLAEAATAVAHEQSALVFAHTSNHAGLRVAIDAGVDVIAHVPDETAGTTALMREAAERGMRLVPTLDMFAQTVSDSPAYLDPIDEALRGFLAEGGRLLFGTDVGYLPVYDIAGELSALERCGLTAADILRSLTTEPAAAFGCTDQGTVSPGMTADLTVLRTACDAPTPLDLAHVAAVVKGGRMIYDVDARP